MKHQPRPTKIDQVVALEWLRYSLSQGSVISPVALRVLQERKGHTYSLVPDTVDTARLARPSEGGVLDACSASKALLAVLEAFAARGAKCLIVEDEVRRRKDPTRSAHGKLATAFVGERVIHWSSFADVSADSMLQVLRLGSHGYPLNAFVTSAAENELGLTIGADLDPNVGHAVINALMAVIVAAYDAETYMIWEPDRGHNDLDDGKPESTQ